VGEGGHGYIDTRRATVELVTCTRRGANARARGGGGGERRDSGESIASQSRDLFEHRIFARCPGRVDTRTDLKSLGNELL
jgi:hypothetical protein